MQKKLLNCDKCNDKKWWDRVIGLNYMCRGCEQIANLANLKREEAKEKKKKRSPKAKKETREIDLNYMAFIRTLKCLIGNEKCFGVMNAHHVISRGAGGSDYTCVPLCYAHHREVHDRGTETFQKEHNVDFEFQIKRLRTLYKISGHKSKESK